MAQKIFLRSTSWYRATSKRHRSDIELSELIDDVNAQYPEVEVEGNGGGSVTIYGPYASNAAALADGRSVGDLYKSTTEIQGSPIILQVV